MRAIGDYRLSSLGSVSVGDNTLGRSGQGFDTQIVNGSRACCSRRK